MNPVCGISLCAGRIGDDILESELTLLPSHSILDFKKAIQAGLEASIAIAMLHMDAKRRTWTLRT